MKSDLKLFYQRLRNEIEDNEEETQTTVLTKIYTDILYDKGIISNYEIEYFEKKIGNTNIKLNGYSYSEEDYRLDLFISDYNTSEQLEKIDFKKILNQIELAKNFFRMSKDKIYSKIHSAERNIQDLSKAIYKDYSKISDVRIFVFTNSLGEKRPKAWHDKRVTYTNLLYDINEIYNASIGGPESTDIRIDFTNYSRKVRCILAQKTKNKIVNYMAFIPGEILQKLYGRYGQRLLNLNVRAFLQLGGKINKGVRQTLIDEPSNFFSYNNGISVVAEKIELKKDNDGTYLTYAEGFQIVNGAQTTAVLYRTKKQDKANFTDVMVPAKITEVRKELISEVVPKISEYANTQNVVKKADFSSNHPFHKEVKELSEKLRTPSSQKWFYERMRGEYHDRRVKFKDLGKNKKSIFLEASPSSMKFAKEDLAKYIITWHYRFPHISSQGAQKNFIFFMKLLNDKKFHDIRNEDFFKKYCCISILFRETNKIIKNNKNITGYKSQVTIYTISMMSYWTNGKINFDRIWNDQDLSVEIKSLIDKWSLKMYEIIQSSAKGKNVSEWCKKEGCWDYLLDRSNKLFKISVAPPEFQKIRSGSDQSARRVETYLSQEDQDNIKRCKTLNSDGWSRILSWGQQSGNLTYKQNSIALTILGYALNNWKKSPSPKQASACIKMILKAEEADII